MARPKAEGQLVARKPLSFDDMLGLVATHTGDRVLARAAGRLKGQPRETVLEALRNVPGVEPHYRRAAIESLERLT